MPETHPRRSVQAAPETDGWLATLDAAALLVGVDGRVQAVNASAESLFGIPRARAVGLHTRDLLPQGPAAAAPETGGADGGSCDRGGGGGGGGGSGGSSGPAGDRAGEPDGSRVAPLLPTAAARAARVACTRLGDGRRLILAWPLEGPAPPVGATFRETLENLTQVVFRTDAEGRWLFLNRAWTRATGQPVAKSVGRSFADFLHPADRERDRALVEPLLKGRQDGGRHIVRYRGRQGGDRWVEVWARRVLDENGRPAGAAGTLTDVTEEHLAHEALLRRDAILEAVAYASERLLREGSLPEGVDDVLARLGAATRVSRIYVFQNHRDGQGRLLLSQRYEWTAPGVPPQIDNPELQGFSWEDAGFHRWVHTMERGEAVHGRVRDFPDNERALLEPQQIKSLLAVPVFAGDEWWGFIGFDDCAHERTWSGVEVDALRSAAGTIGAALERQRAEAERLASAGRLRELRHLRQLDRFKTEFINTAAHELGTPLTPIRLQLHLLKRQPQLTPEQTRALRILDRNVERLVGLVSDVLEGARLQAGRLPVVRKPVALDGVVDEAVESHEAMATAKGVELVREGLCPRAVEADARRLSQVLYNLLDNALTFTPAGGRVTVRTAVEGGRAVVRVSDTGAGLDEDQLERLFQPFSQVHERPDASKPGTGLGLFISRGILEQHGGTIRAHSEGPGKGTEFEFTLPLNNA